VGYRNYWNSVISIAVQTGVSNKILQWKYRKVQKENYFSTGGYPVGDVEFLTEIGSYQNNRMGSSGF
jgi:acid phosphatase family membrane protein YuiD